MEKQTRGLRQYFVLITYAILLYYGIMNFEKIGSMLKVGLTILTPFTMGICIAFVLNLLMKVFEEKIFSGLNKKNSPIWRKMKRPISIVCTFVVITIIFTMLLVFVIPQLSKSLYSLYIISQSQLEVEIPKFLMKYDLTGEFWQKFAINWSEIVKKIGTLISSAVPQIFDITKSITSGVFNFIMGVIFSVYLLAAKERMIKILKKIINAFLPIKAADKVIEVGVIANKYFSAFVSGQLIEVTVLGTLSIIGMLILKMPYAILIGVIIAVTALIPILGPWIGAGIGALIIVMVDPIKALVFIIFIFILQQIDNNFIYPRIVGGTIGISGLWVLLGLLLGGSLYGITGMLIGIPTFAVMYVIIGQVVNKRLKAKNIQIDDYGNKITPQKTSTPNKTKDVETKK